MSKKNNKQAGSLSRILICDDCPFNIVAVQSLLKQLNYDSDFCSNGKEAIEMVKMRLNQGLPLYELILLDYSMPVCDGPTCSGLIHEMLNAH